MGSPVSPVIANLYMEAFECDAIRSAPHPPKWWDRYVDDTNCAIHKDYVSEFHNHLNSIDPCIQFTMEQPNPKGGVPFLDTLITPCADGLIAVSVYRKDTHTDLYLQWDSNHNVSSKLSVVRTLFHRAYTVCSSDEILQKEITHVMDVLKQNGYPTWAIHRGHNCIKNKHSPNSSHSSSSTQVNPKTVTYTTVPYISGFSEKLGKSLGKKGIKVYPKTSFTLQSTLMNPKDKDPKPTQQSLVYGIECPDDQCSAHYIGETGRTLKERFYDHTTKENSAVKAHSTQTGHPLPSIEDSEVHVLAKEPNSFKRKIMESMFIKVNNPLLNRNVGKYELSNIYDKVLNKEGAGLLLK